MALTDSEVMILGRSYDWADVSVTLLGKKVQGIKAIMWEETQTKQNNYGAGNRAISRSRGNVEATGSITLVRKEIIAIENALPPGKKLTDISMFPIIVSYKNDANQFVSYELQYSEFTKNGDSMSQGDMDSQCEIPITIGNVRRVK